MASVFSRRQVFKYALLAAQVMPGAGLIFSPGNAADLTPLDPNDPTAKALGFVTDTAKVDAAANPTHKAGQKCGVCAQFQGKAGDKSGGCNIFAGHTVPEGGWCKVWAQKPGA